MQSFHDCCDRFVYQERRRHEAEAEKKKATPTRHVSPARKAMLTG